MKNQQNLPNINCTILIYRNNYYTLINKEIAKNFI